MCNRRTSIYYALYTKSINCLTYILILVFFPCHPPPPPPPTPTQSGREWFTAYTIPDHLVSLHHAEPSARRQECRKVCTISLQTFTWHAVYSRMDTCVKGRGFKSCVVNQLNPR